MSRNGMTEVDRLELPASLERVEGGIRVAGHRVSLVHVLDAYLDGTPIGRIEELFPTVPSRELGEIISFIERHLGLMKAYHAEQRAAFAAAAQGRSGQAPTLADLRRRQAERVGPGMRID